LISPGKVKSYCETAKAKRALKRANPDAHLVTAGIKPNSGREVTDNAGVFSDVSFGAILSYYPEFRSSGWHSDQRTNPPERRHRSVADGGPASSSALADAWKKLVAQGQSPAIKLFASVPSLLHARRSITLQLSISATDSGIILRRIAGTKRDGGWTFWTELKMFSRAFHRHWTAITQKCPIGPRSNTWLVCLLIFQARVERSATTEIHGRRSTAAKFSPLRSQKDRDRQPLAR